jgi:acyl-coenzyme A synthetase/AMP-(fatty) acid ligase
VSTFFDVARAHPHRLAVLTPEGTAATFGELAARANRLTHALHRLGLGPGDALTARLAEHCRAALAGFKTPKRFDFAERLPRTESGKMLRRTLRRD